MESRSYKCERLELEVLRDSKQLILQIEYKVVYTITFIRYEPTFLVGFIMKKSDGHQLHRIRYSRQLLTPDRLRDRSYRSNTCTVTNVSLSVDDLNSSIFSGPPSYDETSVAPSEGGVGKSA